MTGDRRIVWPVILIAFIATLAASIAVIGLWRQYATVQHSLAAARRDVATQQQQIRGLERALRRCHQTHGRRCERPAPPTPTPQPTTLYVVPGSPAPQPTSPASATPARTRSPAPEPRPSPSAHHSPSTTASPTPTCTVGAEVDGHAVCVHGVEGHDLARPADTARVPALLPSTPCRVLVAQSPDWLFLPLPMAHS